MTMIKTGSRIYRDLDGKRYHGTVVGHFEDTVFVQWDNGTLTVLDEHSKPVPKVVHGLPITMSELFSLLVA